MIAQNLRGGNTRLRGGNTRLRGGFPRAVFFVVMVHVFYQKFRNQVGVSLCIQLMNCLMNYVSYICSMQIWGQVKTLSMDLQSRTWSAETLRVGADLIKKETGMEQSLETKTDEQLQAELHLLQAFGKWGQVLNNL